MPRDRGSTTGIELAPARGPSPDPSPLVPRGEGRIRSRAGNIGPESTSPSMYKLLAPAVEVRAAAA
jgi:hypothetical protein